MTSTLAANVQSIIDGTGKEITDENSNKNPYMISTQRDLIAGEVSKSIGIEKWFPKKCLEAHEKGMIHIHDSDYAISPGQINCCLPHFSDMLLNGTVINGVAIESPKSFQVACTVFTQIIACIASNQYGGQSCNNFPEVMAPFVDRSRQRNIQFLKVLDAYANSSDEEINALAEEMTKKDVEDGLQTIQYQINTLMSSNGQSPFLTLFLNFDPDAPIAHDAAMVTEELLRQRLQGVKNQAGVYVTPAFPKLIYCVDEYNIHDDSPYFYLTELAAKCTARRMYPDYISAKKMRENYEGLVFSPMGCRSFLPPYKDKDTGEYVVEGRFNKGVCTINLPNIALSVGKGNVEEFFEELDRRLEEYVYPTLLARHNFVKSGTTSGSPIHWVHGALARLPYGEPIPEKYLTGRYSTLSIGYLGVNEACYAVLGESHTTEDGKKFAFRIMEHLNAAADRWNEKTFYGFSVYGTPAEALVDKACRKDRNTFGAVENVTDRQYYTNSFHVHSAEPITVFDKFEFEAQFQKLSQGGNISYAELGDLNNNPEAMIALIRYGYGTIPYFEFNLRGCDSCICGFVGEGKYDAETDTWSCPQCGNSDQNTFKLTKRVCGYLTSQKTLQGKSLEIFNRVIHI